MAKIDKPNNRRKAGGGSRTPWIYLVLVVMIILVVFFLLEKVRRSAPPKSEETPAVSAPAVTQQSPAVTPPQPQYSTAVLPSAAPKAKKPRPSGPGTMAIIVDDLGSNMAEAKALLEIRYPITFSIIPNLARSRAVAETAHASGHEVMLHIPMEPQGYPKQRLEANGLLVSLSEGEIETRVNSYLQSVPYAIGANNHMGSRFTEYETKMQPVLRVLKGHDMFFIDSMTSPQSVGHGLARSMGLMTGMRQVFLDNVQDVASISTQLDQAADIARKKGGAIVICHPHKITIQVLSSIMPKMARTGITFVYASQLVH